MKELIEKAEILLGEHFKIANPGREHVAEVLSMMKIILLKEVGEKLDELLRRLEEDGASKEFARKFSVVTGQGKQEAVNLRPYAGNS